MYRLRVDTEAARVCDILGPRTRGLTHTHTLRVHVRARGESVRINEVAYEALKNC